MRRALLAAGIATTILFLAAGAAIAGGGGGCTTQTEGTGDTVRMRHFCFTPSILHVDEGTEVTFVNDDPFDHVVIGTGWHAGSMLALGDEAVHRFDRAGIYPYTCNLHHGMNGVVIVGEDAATPAASIEPLETAGSTRPGLPGWSLLAVPLAALGGFLLSRRLGPGRGSPSPDATV